jgi:hypothetical protein
MVDFEERFLVYAALLVPCSTLSAFAGPGAGIWTLLQVAMVVEMVYWIGFERVEDAERDR